MPSNGVKESRTQLAQLRDYIQMFLGMTQGLTGEARDQILGALGSAGLGQFQQLLDESLGVRAGIPEAFGRLSTTWFPVEMQDAMRRLPAGMDSALSWAQNDGRTGRSDAVWDRLQDLQNFGVGPVRQASQGVLDAQGWTPGSALLRDIAQQLTRAEGFSAELADTQRLGMGLLASGGQSADTRGMLQMAQQLMASGGRDAGTRQLVDAGQNLVSTGGMTQDMTQFLNMLAPVMQQGGMTPEARQLFGKMMEIVNAGGAGGAVMDDTQAMSMARDQVAQATRQAAEAARRQAMQRQGAAAVSGLSGVASGEFENAAMQAEAQALRDTAFAQQEARLGQLGMASGVAGDITKASQGLLGQYAAAGADIFRSAASNLNAGAGLMQAGEQLAANRLGLGFESANAALQQELARMGMGGDLVGLAGNLAQQRMGLGMNMGAGLEQLASNNVQNAQQNLIGEAGLRLSAGGALGQQFATESARALQGLSSLQGLAGTAMQGSFGQQGMDLQRVQAQLTATLQSLGLDQGTINSLVGQWLQGSQGLGQLGSIYGGLANTGLNGFNSVSNSLIQAAMQPGFWSRLGQTVIGGAIGGLTGGLAGGLTNSLTGQGGFVGPQVAGNPAWDVPGGWG